MRVMRHAINTAGRDFVIGDVHGTYGGAGGGATLAR